MVNTKAILILAGLAGASVLVGQLGLGRTPPGGEAAGGECADPNAGPDVIVGDLMGIMNWGSDLGITGYSIGTIACNVGTENLLWEPDGNSHPLIAQNMYRLKDGRFEQIGMSWLKHTFAALAENLCCTCNGDSGFVLGVGCSDPYFSNLNGDQNGFQSGFCPLSPVCGGLGPRSEVNVSTGFFLWPYRSAGVSGAAPFKRIQVKTSDLDPALNPGSRYFAEGQFVAADDVAAGNHHNNASYRWFIVAGFDKIKSGWDLFFTSFTHRRQPAIMAWKAIDPAVAIETVDDHNNGRFHLGYRVTDNGDGTWHYEYALTNLDSDRSARSFSIPVPEMVMVTGVGFHDVDYHSGEPYTNEDWIPEHAGGAVTWSTGAFADNPNHNALRWGTLYNFRFDADSPPVRVTATIGLFKQGTPPEVSVVALGPSNPLCPWDLNGNGAIDVPDLLALLAIWGTAPGGPPDFDGNGEVGIADLCSLLANWGSCPG